MNERIRDLALSAHSDALESYRERMKTEFAGDVIFSDMYDQKFAELIVRECVEQASIGNGHGNNQWDRALTFAGKNIKEHFGVEE